MRIQFTLAARYLAGRKLRTFLTTLAVIFGVMVIFGLNGMLPAMMEAMQRNMLAAAGKVDLAVTSVTGNTFSPEIADKIRGVPGVSAVSPILRRNMTLPPGKYPVNAITVVGLDPENAPRVRQYPVAKGRFLKKSDTNAVLLSEELASKLKVGPGDTIKFPASTGTIKTEVVGVLSTPSAPGVPEIYMPLATAQAMFGDGTWINTAEVAFKPGFDRKAIEKEVKARVGSGYRLGALESGSEFVSALRIGQFALNIFGVMALAMGAFIILNTFRTAVAERRHDIGILRAVGASRRTVLGAFLAEGLLQGIMGTGIGLATGYLLTVSLLRILNPIYEQYMHVTVGRPSFTPGIVALAVGLGLGVTLLGALAPAIRASRLTPLEALRPMLGEAYERAARGRAIVGVVLLVLSTVSLLTRNISVVALATTAFLVGIVLVAPALINPLTKLFSSLVDAVFRREGLLARSNLTRQPNRAAITASAVMISLAIVLSLVGMVKSITDGFMSYLDKSMGTDFVVLPQSLVLAQGNVGAVPELKEKIQSTPGVQAATSLRLASSQIDGAKIQVIGIDPKPYGLMASFDFSKGGSQQTIPKLAGGRNLIANGIFAAQKGLSPGDTLTLATPRGKRQYRIAAVGSDYLNAKIPTVYLSQANLKNDFHITADILFLVNKKPGSSVAQVQTALKKVLTGYPAFVLYDRATWRKQLQDTLSASMTMYYLLITLLALPSLLALINTLTINVVARTREIGMLRAVGGTRRQIRRLILAESLLMASIGVVFGVLAGILLSYVFVGALNSSGYKLPYYFPWLGLLITVAIGMVFGILASLLPARQAARLDIVEALHYE